MCSDLFLRLVCENCTSCGMMTISCIFLRCVEEVKGIKVVTIDGQSSPHQPMNFKKHTVSEEKQQEVNSDLKCQFGVSGILHM